MLGTEFEYHPRVLEIAEKAKFWANTFQDKVQITYPQMQGPFSNFENRSFIFI